MGIFDTALGIGGSLLSGALNNQAASDRQDAAQTFSAQQYASRYQTTVADMQSAGLNPALAYGGISGNSPTSSAASSAGTPDIGASFNQSRMASAQVANIAADTENKHAQAGLIQAQTAQAHATASQSTAQLGHIDASIKKIVEETKNIPTEGERLKFVIQQLAEDAALKAQQGHTQVSIRDELAHKIAKLRAETKLIGFDIDAASSLGNIGRNTGQMKPIFDILRGLIRK